MDVNRVKAIVDSPDRFEVELNGKSVWIDSVDAQTKMATVHEQTSGTQESMTVRVDELREVGKMDTQV